MNNHSIYGALLASLIAVAPLQAQSYFEVTHPHIFSFEKSPEPVSGDSFSKLSVTGDHYKHQSKALHWQWSKANATITIKQPIPYQKNNPNPKERSISTFLFWAYNKQPFTNKTLRFEFYKQGKLCTWFDYGLDFKGWHGAWVAFDRDMHGTPQEGMDELRIIAPDVETGELILDQIVPSSFQDARHHTAGFQSPFINKATTSHWLVLLKSWDKKLDITPQSTLSAMQKQSIHKIEARMEELLERKSKLTVDKMRKQFDEYLIEENEDGTLRGKTIFFLRHAEAFYNLGGPRSTKWYGKDGRAFKQACEFLFEMANLYRQTKDEDARQEIAQKYTTLTRHLQDQGFMAGSEMGTLHHLGYSIRHFYQAHFLMRDALRQAGLGHDVQQAMEWFSGVGEVKVAPAKLGMDIDTFNTALLGRLCSLLMLEDSPYKAAYLQAFARWADNGYKYTDGTGACFKVDGTLFHHRINYPAYAIGGFDGAVDCIWLLHDTPFAISQESHANMKKALLLMRTYCNKRTWPLSLSGRHPDGRGHLVPHHFAVLAKVGSPDGAQEIDQELASAYMRLTSDLKPTSFNKEFAQAGIQAEVAPQGNWAINYSSLNIHRRDEWSATVMGHSRYLWASEIYLGANHYGRYLNHGQLQILNQGDPIDLYSNGFRQEGWDWNHFPGTTAAVYPMKELKANVLNLDKVSGYEEMLLSDESYAGALSLDGKQGMYAMKLHEHDKYNGSLRANKSYFFFDDRIVCLGSDIQNNTPGHEAHTTLFQDFLDQESTPVSLNREQISTFPYQEEIQEKVTHLADTRGNHYIVRGGADVTLQKQLQHSLHEEKDTPTKNNFSLAYINHGEVLMDGRYEYMVLVDGQEADAQKAVKKAPYEVLQQNNRAHIVHDKATATTAYALFEAGETSYQDQITSVNLPSMVMVQEQKKGEILLSATDPDLRFYQGSSDDMYDINGKRLERSVYSRYWINNPAGESTLVITLPGHWEAADESEWTVKKEGKQTRLSVACQHGLTKQIRLKKL